MKQQTIICDKCKKELSSTNHDNYPNEVSMKNGYYVLDLCPSCYSKLLKIIGTWLEEKEGEK